MPAESSAGPVESNPFATRFVKPGAVEFDFDGTDTLSTVTSRLAAQRWRGAIVGPHGSGKSTLLAALIPQIEAAGKTALVHRLHDRQRSLQPWPDCRSIAPGETLVVVDGYEQLSRWSRWRLQRLCRQCRLGLLVTSHQPNELPLLVRTNPTPLLAARLAAQWLGQELSPVWQAACAASFAGRAGNVREVAFDLYDFYELQRRPNLPRI
jgi:hypothetical protein